ncbi:hypothetical protein [Mesorhizobium sp. M0187]|uniref:hypothetical protein n=1 Tax=Mesorhizobium sp. M0187 TaxID=2956908 RepID=UPI00333B5359
MPTLQQNIAHKFVAALAEGQKVDNDKTEQIRKLLANGKKPKAEDLVKIFLAPTDGDVK